MLHPVANSSPPPRAVSSAGSDGNRTYVVLTLLTATFVGWWAWPTPRMSLPIGKDPGSAPIEGPLHVDLADLDFGETFENKAFAWTIAVQNQSAESVVVSRFETGCDCATPQPQSATIPAGGQQIVRLTIDTSRKPSSPAGSAARPTEYPLTAVFPSGKLNRWKLRGRVKPLIDVTRPDTMANDLYRDGPAPSWVVRVRPAVPVTRLSVASTKHVAEPTIDHDGRDYLLTIRPQTGTVGQMSGSVALELADAAGRRLPTQTLPLPFRVTERVHPVPGQLALGAIKVGTEQDEVMVFRSRAGERLTALEVVSNSPGVTVRPVTSDRPHEDRWVVCVRPAEPGHGAGIVRWRSRDSRGPIEVSVPVAWYGVVR